MTGLDLGHRDMNGPLLVRNVAVHGFGVGVRTGHSVNGQVFERLSLRGQSEYGFLNAGQCVGVRRLESENAVPAVRTESFATLLDCALAGTGDAKSRAAVEAATGGFHARTLTATGYKAAIADAKGKAVADGPAVAEFFAGKATSPFGGEAKSLGLPVKETPDVPWDDPKDWAVVDAFGADPTGVKDSSAAVQKAIDSGATTVFFPGFYAIEKAVTVRDKVRRLLGTGGWIDYAGKSKPDLAVGDGDAKVVVIEHFAPINGSIRIASDRTVVIRSVEARTITHAGKGPLFLEDVSTDDFRVRPGREVWARQLNVENQGAHVTNDGGTLWVLGYKTERGGTLLHTKGGGRSEVFGTLSYTTTAGKLAPMFVTEDASAFAVFAELCYTGDPFAVLVRETRDKVTREVKAGAGTVAPYVGVPAKE